MTATQPQTQADALPAGFWDGVANSYIPPAELSIAPGLRLHEHTAPSVDPITFEVVRYALLNLNFEHAALIQRLCVSPITMLTRDFQCSVLTERGDLVFLGPNLQYFSNSHALSIKWTLENRSGNPGIGPGDMFLANDPYIGAPHQPDTAILAPVFLGDELFCWVANTMHLSDTGGSMQGSFCITAQDAWGDPPNFPPIKLVEGGTVRSDVEELFARQSRLPVAVRMDVRAAVTANEATRAKIVHLCERYGADTVKAVMHGVLDAGEELFAERLASIPDGRWSHRAYTEAAVPGDREVYAYQINIAKTGDRLVVDNEGTDPQAGSINVTYAAFSGAVLAAITAQMTSDLAGAYGGVYRRVEFRPTPGLLNCASFPAAVSPSGAFTTEMQLNAAAIAVAKMLACGDDEARRLILGPCLPHFYGTIMGGLDGGGNMFIFPNTNGMMGGLAGMPERDGVDVGGLFWIPEGIAYNTEDIEGQYPLLLLYRRLLDQGADGAGRHRGGLGFVECVAPHGSPYISMQLYANEAFTKGQGLAGGNPGSRASFRVRHETGIDERMQRGEVPMDFDSAGGQEVPQIFKGAPVDMVPGSMWEWTSPSAAGYGDPVLRDASAVEADIAAGALDAAVAERVYGVVAGDADATAARRRAMLAERLGRDPGPPVDPPAGARRAGELLFLVDGRWWCNGADLGPGEANYKDGCEVRERAAREIAPEFAALDVEMADKMVFREFLCPVTGLRIDTEIARAGTPYLHDVRIDR